MSLNLDKIEDIMNEVCILETSSKCLEYKFQKTKALMKELMKLGPDEKIPYHLFFKINISNILCNELEIGNRLYLSLINENYESEHIFEVETPDDYKSNNYKGNECIKLDFDKYDILIDDTKNRLGRYCVYVIDTNNHTTKMICNADYLNKFDGIFTDEEFVAIKKMVEANKLLLEMRAN